MARVAEGDGADTQHHMRSTTSRVEPDYSMVLLGHNYPEVVEYVGIAVNIFIATTGSHE